MFIYPYRTGSQSVKAIKLGLGAKILKLVDSKFKGSEGKVVINWGNSTPNPEVGKCIVMNNPENVAIAANKKNFFEAALHKCRIPPFTQDRDKAKKWLEEGKTVVVREKLSGHSGEGIVILNSVEDYEAYNHVRSKLYVQYIPKKYEYRIHIIGEQVVLSQRKAKRSDLPNDHVNWKVRNHANGFVFVKNEDKPIPDDVYTQAHAAIQAVGLDFGAVDIVWNEYKQEATVLEINSAPGLEGTSGDAYVEGLKAYANLLGEQGEGNKKTKPRNYYANIINTIQTEQNGMVIVDEALNVGEGDEDGEEF